MEKPKLPKNENERLILLKELGLLDTGEEKIFDKVTQLAAEICQTPICLISLIDEKRQWFKSHHGLDATETPREYAFCAHAINQTETFIVPDATKDDRFFDNPLVTGKPNVIFYAGAQLKLPSGHNLGTLCVIDHNPKELSPIQIGQLNTLAEHLVDLFLLRSRFSYLEILERAKESWLANLVHDFKNPLNAIVGITDIIQTDFATLSEKEKKSFLESMVKSSDSLMALVDDVLDLGKLESDCIEVTPTRIDAVLLVKDVQQELTPVAMKLNKKISLLNLPTKLECTADLRRLKQVLTNIFSNAIKYSSSESEIKIQLNVESNFVLISVTNQGPGISANDIPKLFQKYGRLINPDENLNKRIHGTGLGLYLSKKLLDKMNGAIHVQSTINETTTFTVSIPK